VPAALDIQERLPLVGRLDLKGPQKQLVRPGIPVSHKDVTFPSLPFPVRTEFIPFPQNGIYSVFRVRTE
jgi:hypothetical protein